MSYNGWINYETWRINLEFGLTDGGYDDHDAEMLENHVNELLELDCNNETTLCYARAFIENVVWDEIVRHIEEE